MTVSLYVNYSEPNRLSKNISAIGSFSGNLKGECSVINPTILIEAGNISGANYMYIGSFGRYYYITDIVSVRDGLWMVSGHVDVLTTYASSIRACSALVSRQESDYNLYLTDDRFLVDTRREYSTIAFPGRAPSGGDSLVLTIAGS